MRNIPYSNFVLLRYPADDPSADLAAVIDGAGSMETIQRCAAGTKALEDTSGEYIYAIAEIKCVIGTVVVKQGWKDV
jgi:hypothetical protein